MICKDVLDIREKEKSYMCFVNEASAFQSACFQSREDKECHNGVDTTESQVCTSLESSDNMTSHLAASRILEKR